MSDVDLGHAWRAGDREQAGYLRERLGRDAQRVVDLARGLRQLHLERLRGDALSEQRAGVEAIAKLGWHATGGRMRMPKQPHRLEPGQLVAQR